MAGLTRARKGRAKILDYRGLTLILFSNAVILSGGERRILFSNQDGAEPESKDLYCSESE
jgi:hypothetical protein